MLVRMHAVPQVSPQSLLELLRDGWPWAASRLHMGMAGSQGAITLTALLAAYTAKALRLQDQTGSGSDSPSGGGHVAAVAMGLLASAPPFGIPNTPSAGCAEPLRSVAHTPLRPAPGITLREAFAALEALWHAQAEDEQMHGATHLLVRSARCQLAEAR